MKTKMNLDAYMKIMEKTSDFAYTIRLSSIEDHYNPRSEGRVEERKNEIAKGLFQREFLKKYEGKEIVFENEEGKEASVKFKDMMYKNNAGMYFLTFEDGNNNIRPKGFETLHITACACIYNKTSEEGLKNFLGENWKISDKSVEVLKEMLGYSTPGLKSYAGNKPVEKYIKETLSSN